jgi:hypothetical protein
MTDEADAPPVEGTDSRAEWHEYAAGCVIFPFGVDYFAEQSGALAIRIPDKSGDIEILEAGKGWRDVAKANRTGTVAAVK